MSEDARIESLWKFREAELAIVQLVSSPELFKSDISDSKSTVSVKADPMRFNRIHTLKQYESLEMIAYQYGVSSEEIIKRNNLTFPYLDTTITRKESTSMIQSEDQDPIGQVLYVGDSLLIPSSNELDFIDIQEDAESIGEKIYGSDLKLINLGDDEFDLCINSDQTDLAVIGGINGVKQSLDIMLNNSNFIIDYPRYRNPLTPGKKTSPFRIAYEKIVLLRSILLDLRISSAQIYRITIKQGIATYLYKAFLRDKGEFFKGEIS